MTRKSHEITFSTLPETIPILPLYGVLLLPGGQIELNIYELRYLNMVEDVLTTRERMIGVVIPREKNPKKDAAALYEIGTVGRVTSFEENVDGRYTITLTGYCRFYTREEVTTLRGYRRMVVEWDGFQGDLSVNPEPRIAKERLISLLKRYLKKIGIEVDWEAIIRAPTFNIITFFSMNLPFEDRDKQALLEAETVEERAEILISLLEIGLADSTQRNFEQ